MISGSAALTASNTTTGSLSYISTLVSDATGNNNLVNNGAQWSANTPFA